MFWLRLRVVVVVVAAAASATGQNKTDGYVRCAASMYTVSGECVLPWGYLAQHKKPQLTQTLYKT